MLIFVVLTVPGLAARIYFWGWLWLYSLKKCPSIDYIFGFTYSPGLAAVRFASTRMFPAARRTHENSSYEFKSCRLTRLRPLLLHIGFRRAQSIVVRNQSINHGRQQTTDDRQTTDDTQHSTPNTHKMATPAFLCSPPMPPYACTFISTTPEAVIAHLEKDHSEIILYKRRYGRNALTRLPIAVTLNPATHNPVNGAPLGLKIFLCVGCEEYFVHGRALIEHLLEDPRHSEETAAARDDMGEYNFDDAMLAETSRVVTLGAPPVPVAPPILARQIPVIEAPPAQQLRSRLMVNFTAPYAHPSSTVILSVATTSIGEFTVALHMPYGLERNINWDTIWRDGLVVRYAGSDGGTGWMVVRDEDDVRALVAVMDVGECWVGDGMRA